MTPKLTISRLLIAWMIGLTIAFFLIIGFILQRNISDINDGFRQNLRFRSSLFKESIESSVMMGDYSSVVAKANSFLAQSDVFSIAITLRDGSSLFNLSKNKPIDPGNFFSTDGMIFIKDKASDSQTGVASVEVNYELSSLESSLGKIFIQGAGASLAFLLATISFALYFSRKFSIPIKKLSRVALDGDLQAISRIDKSAAIAEVFALEGAIQQMGTQLIDLNEKEKVNFKNAAVGRLIAGLSHDLRAPLAVFERLINVSDEQMPAMRQSLKRSLDRLYSMVESLRYSEIETLVKRSSSPFNLQFGLETLNDKAEGLGISLLAPTSDFGVLFLDSLKVERSWVNLASNAIDFARNEVRIEVEIKGADLRLRIIDDGEGVPDEFLPKLFQRGATHGKADGTGLGLAYVRQIMRGHGGDVSYRRENGLTIFECILPNAVESEEGQQVEKSATLEIQLLQKTVRKVAICLEPRELSASVLAKMASLKSDEFVFIEERQEADIVVSNIDSIMFEVMESDEQELISVAQFKHDEDFMIEMLKLKFNLPGDASGV